MNPLSLAPSTGFTTVQENVGKVLNRGFDLRAGATVWQQPADRSYLSFSLMISRNKNILKEISEAMRSYNEQQEKLATEGNVPVQKYYDGVSMDAIWAMPSLGIDPANGREIYIAKDENGNPYRTYTYDAAQQVICGDELPKFQGNAGVNFEYKGFGINAVLTYQYGAKMYNQTLVDKVENADMKYNVAQTGRYRLVQSNQRRSVCVRKAAVRFREDISYLPFCAETERIEDILPATVIRLLPS